MRTLTIVTSPAASGTACLFLASDQPMSTTHAPATHLSWCLITALLISLLSMSCTPHPRYPACGDMADCERFGEYCLFGECVMCRSSAHCSGACQVCERGTCVPKRGCCVSDDDCTVEVPKCGPDHRCHQCLRDDDCGPGYPCNDNSCYRPKCLTSGICPEGYRCINEVCTAIDKD